jgi:FMN phosphatase YigB (HAD superfamily)
MARVFSFDVFDTLIARGLLDPRDVFIMAALDLAGSLDLPISAEAYATERYQAERRLLALGRYPPLADIAVELSRTTGLSPLIVDLLVAQELLIETRILWPIEKQVHEVRALREAGERIIFVSDTYLSSDFLKSILVRLEIAAEDEEVFVSCEHGAGKKTGALFTTVAERLGIDAKDIFHCGDNPDADVAGARLAGAQGRLVAHTNANKYESAIRRFGDSYPVTSTVRLQLSEAAGALRRTRLSNGQGNDPLFDVAAGVAAPMLYFFVRFTLRRARARGINRLYFLARDGDLLLKIARLLCCGQADPPELRYLHVSREVALLASLGKVADAGQLWSLLIALTPASVGSAIERMAGPDSRLAKHLNAELGQPLRVNPDCKLLRILIDDPSLYEEVVAHNQPMKEKFNEYLAQEGLFSSQSACALVDVGWRLTMHELLAKAVRLAGGISPAGFYLGIYARSTDVTTGLKEGYLWDSREMPPLIGLDGITRAIETFCTADHGKTRAYQRTATGSLGPVQSDLDVGQYLEWGLPRVRAGCLAGCEALHALPALEDFEPWERLLCGELLGQFWRTPTVDEIKAWGSFPFEPKLEDGAKAVPLYVPSTLARKAFYLLRHASWRGNHANSWPSATRWMTPTPIRQLLDVMLLIRGRYRR